MCRREFGKKVGKLRPVSVLFLYRQEVQEQAATSGQACLLFLMR